MRALTRMRMLAAVCALLLMLAGTAMARLPGSPIDQGGTPPVNPPMVGDPDDSQGLVVIPTPYGIFILRLSTHQVQMMRRAQSPAAPVRIRAPPLSP